MALPETLSNLTIDVSDDGIVEMFWEEPGREDNCESDPYGETSPEQILSDITGE